jgi:hypothetical protein
VRVLGEFEVTTNAGVWALYPSAKHVLPRMRVLLDCLADWFRDQRASRALPRAEAAPLPRANGAAAANGRAKVQLRAR